MVYTSALTFATAAILAAVPVNASLYSKSSPVIQVDGKNYDRLISQSNYTSIVEFYAPWCGHCKNLQPAFEKAAKSLQGLAKVAAVNCDEESNKPFCGSMGVQGFPTLKIVRPGSKPGKPTIEDYQGARTAKGIVEAVTDKINNHVKKVEDKNLESWLAASNETAKAILFTEKGKTSALLKAVAIDFKGVIEVAQVRNTQKASVELFGITKYPTLLLLPGGKEAQGIVYDGELKKDAIVKFLSQAATPNQDPPPAKAKAKSTKSKAPKKAKESSTKTKATSAETSTSATEESAEKATEPAAESATEPSSESSSESPTAEAKPAQPTVEPAPPIPLIDSNGALETHCLGPKTGTCILVFLPKEPNEVVLEAIKGLSEIHWNHFKQGRKIFPFYAVAPVASNAVKLSETLGLRERFDIIAINARRGWWRPLPRKGEEIEEADHAMNLLEDWVESIKLGDGAKKKLPEGLVPEEKEEPVVADPVEEPAAVPVEEPIATESEPVQAEESAKPEEPVKDTHDEL